MIYIKKGFIIAVVLSVCFFLVLAFILFFATPLVFLHSGFVLASAIWEAPA